jgi:hypothetical protein
MTDSKRCFWKYFLPGSSRFPEFGTVTAKSIPFVVLTSNEERRLGDPIRRRSLYVRVEHPTPEREAEIIASRTPKADEKFHREMAGIALSFRNYSLEKPPSVSEMIDFANALQLLGTDHVTEEHRDVLLPFLAKTEKDRRHLLLREGFKSLLDDGARFAQSLDSPWRADIMKLWLPLVVLIFPRFAWLKSIRRRRGNSYGSMRRTPCTPPARKPTYTVREQLHRLPAGYIDDLPRNPLGICRGKEHRYRANVVRLPDAP